MSQHHCGVGGEHGLQDQMLLSVDSTGRERIEMVTEELDEGFRLCSVKLKAHESIYVHLEAVRG